ncbi:CinA family protein [Salinibacterium sp. ZJ450]|uniref:CinA family protein n=1 Tax=Salinibacterium sp. ZJ450 TaxID=2708338 RepID=UPI00141F496F|nr:nicotinamide-nucleotide amidohydrolase family protein [Salinibacterium sp. ZJ450]
MSDSVIPGKPDAPATFITELVADLAARGLTLAVAESLTGGLLTAEFIRPAGASAVVVGGVVAYDTALKASLLGVDQDLLDAHGPVHPEVARQMADRVRHVLAVDGRPADLGLSTTGVAGPDPQEGAAVGTVFIGIAVGRRTDAVELHLDGSRDQIRARVVGEAVAALAARI